MEMNTIPQVEKIQSSDDGISTQGGCPKQQLPQPTLLFFFSFLFIKTSSRCVLAKL